MSCYLLLFDRHVSLDFEDFCVAAAFFDRLEENRPKITVRSALQFASVCNHRRHQHCDDREGDVRLVADATEDLDGAPPARLLQLSACLPGTSPPPSTPPEANTLQLKRGACLSENVAAPNATCLELSGVTMLLPESSEATTRLLSAH